MSGITKWFLEVADGVPKKVAISAISSAIFSAAIVTYALMQKPDLPIDEPRICSAAVAADPQQDAKGLQITADPESSRYLINGLKDGRNIEFSISKIDGNMFIGVARLIGQAKTVIANRAVLEMTEWGFGVLKLDDTVKGGRIAEFIITPSGVPISNDVVQKIVDRHCTLTTTVAIPAITAQFTKANVK
jgi:hypothetical protein